MAEIEIDIDHRIGAIARSVGDAERDGQPLKAVIATEVYPSPPGDVWEAITDPARLARWFLPVTGDLRLGGTYRIEGNAGGEVLACEPGERLFVTWVYDGQVSWVEVVLTAEGEGTRLRLTHLADADDMFWDRYGPGATGVGWESALIGLSLHLATGGDVDREAFQAWEAGAEARRFFAAIAAAWGEADAAGGADPDAARRRAEEVAAFYTGDAPAGGGGTDGEAS